MFRTFPAAAGLAGVAAQELAQELEPRQAEEQPLEAERLRQREEEPSIRRRTVLLRKFSVLTGTLGRLQCWHE